MAATDVLTLAEAKTALNTNSGTGNDTEITLWITAVSARLDDLCGAVVIRTVTDEVYDGGRSFLPLRQAPVSKTSATTVTTVKEYASTTLTTLTAETNDSKPSDGFLFDPTLGFLYRRASGSGGTFASGRQNVLVTYDAGRYATTADVDGRFKLTAGAILRRLWHREQGAWARGGDPFEPGAAGAAGFFKTVSDTMIREFLADELRPPVVA